MFASAARRARRAEGLEAASVGAPFLGPSPDLGCLTGVERQIPSLGEAANNPGERSDLFERVDECRRAVHSRFDELVRPPLAPARHGHALGQESR